MPDPRPISDTHTKTDPRYVIFSLFGEKEGNMGPYVIGALQPKHSATVYDATKAGKKFANTGLNNQLVTATQRWAIDALRAHVKQHGTLKEIFVTGHGNTNTMSAKDWTNEINIQPFLRAIAALEKELGKKIVDRVVFDGCLTLSKMSGQDIKFYSDFSKDHDVDLVGTTSLTRGATTYGRYIKFTPSGQITRDGLDKRYTRYALGDWEDRSWIRYYLDTPKATAEKNIRTDLESYVTSLVNFQPITLLRKEGNVDVRPDLKRNIEELNRLAVGGVAITSPNLRSAIIFQNDGSIQSFGDSSLYPMNPQQQYAGLKALNLLNQYMKGGKSASDALITYKEVSKRLDKDSEYSVYLTFDQKKVVLVSQQGNYCVYDLATKKPLTTFPTLTPAEEKAARTEIDGLLTNAFAIHPEHENNSDARKRLSEEKTKLLARAEFLDAQCATTSIAIDRQTNQAVMASSDGKIKSFGALHPIQAKDYDDFSVHSAPYVVERLRGMSSKDAAFHVHYSNGSAVVLEDQKHVLIVDKNDGRHGIYSIATGKLAPMKPGTPITAKAQQLINKELAETLQKAFSIDPESSQDPKIREQAAERQRQLLTQVTRLDLHSSDLNMTRDESGLNRNTRLLSSDGLVLSYDGTSVQPYDSNNPKIAADSKRLVVLIKEYQKEGLSLDDAIDKYNHSPLFTGSALVALKNDKQLLFAVNGGGFSVIDLASGEMVPQPSFMKTPPRAESDPSKTKPAPTKDTPTGKGR